MYPYFYLAVFLYTCS